MLDAPRFETDRLLLRPPTPEDLDDAAAMWGDPQVVRFVGQRTFSREETWRKLLAYAGHWALFGWGYFVARERTSGRFVGEVGFADFKRSIDPSLEGMAEAGWVLSPWAHGRGLATEAVSAALRWLGRPAVCIIDPGNVASLRVAAKCGFEEWTRTSYHDHTTVVLRRRAVDA
jgi:RimJ/RimL family protein N-acetyltransferase